jgi:hypothetical protein
MTVIRGRVIGSGSTGGIRADNSKQLAVAVGSSFSIYNDHSTIFVFEPGVGRQVWNLEFGIWNMEFGICLPYFHSLRVASRALIVSSRSS